MRLYRPSPRRVFPRGSVRALRRLRGSRSSVEQLTAEVIEARSRPIEIVEHGIVELVRSILVGRLRSLANAIGEEGGYRFVESSRESDVVIQVPLQELFGNRVNNDV